MITVTKYLLMLSFAFFSLYGCKETEENADIKPTSKSPTTIIKPQQADNHFDWKNYIRTYAQSDCVVIPRYRKHTEAECKQMFVTYQNAVSKGTRELQQQGFETLETNQSQYCQLGRQKYSICSVWENAHRIAREQYFQQMELPQLYKLKTRFCSTFKENCQVYYDVVEKKEAHFIQRLTLDDQLLITEYNKCRQFYLTLPTHLPSYQKANETKKTYPCTIVSKAANERNMEFGFTQFAKDLR